MKCFGNNSDLMSNDSMQKKQCNQFILSELCSIKMSFILVTLLIKEDFKTVLCRMFCLDLKFYLSLAKEVKLICIFICLTKLVFIQFNTPLGSSSSNFKACMAATPGAFSGSTSSGLLVMNNGIFSNSYLL